MPARPWNFRILSGLPLKKQLVFSAIFALLPLLAQAMTLQIQGSDAKLSYDVTKHIPIIGAESVHGDLSPESASHLSGSLTTSDTAGAGGLYTINGRITLQNPDFVTDSEIRDNLVRGMIDQNGINVGIVNVRSLAQSQREQTALVNVTINGITQQVPLQYQLAFAYLGASRIVIMRGQMVVDRAKFNMSIHGVTGFGDFMIDRNFVVKFELPFRN